jgi:prepilin-type N-terminal cleavage/methylation domain-containing protein
MNPISTRTRAGFTLIEMMIAVVVGVLVLSSATSLALTTFRSMSGLQMRDGIDRNARFVGLTLQRDLAETGVDLESLADFGTLAVWNDSVSILRIPYEPGPAPVYPLSIANAPGNGMCGLTCVEIQGGGTAPALVIGDIARFQLNQQRRLIQIIGIAPVANGAYRVSFSNLATVIQHASGMVTGLTNANAPSAVLQKVQPVLYWRQGTQLMRATRLNPGGTFAGEVIADGVQSFTASLIFTDGDEATSANPTDADGTNDYNDIAGIRVRAVLQSDRADPRVNGGVPLSRSYEWFVAPRNLIYERNRVTGP